MKKKKKKEAEAVLCIYVWVWLLKLGAYEFYGFLWVEIDTSLEEMELELGFVEESGVVSLRFPDLAPHDQNCSPP